MRGTAPKILPILLLGVIGCSESEGPEETTAAAKVETAYEEGCIGPEGFTPPHFTMSDILYVLTNRVPFYSANPAALFTGNWTNWYEETDMRNALAKLAVMRGILDKFNLYDLYLSPLPAASCPADAATVRQIDGTCNNLAAPSQGAAGIRFGRNIPPLLPKPGGGFVKNAAANPDYAKILDPNPRDISRKLFKRKEFQGVPFLNLLAAAWIQFQVHDWFDHGENSTTDFFTIPLAEDDELREKYGIDSLRVAKTANDPTRTPTENALLPPTYKNAVTHWWDGSQVYGSDLATANRLRAFTGGRLLVDDSGLLPTAADGFEDTGMRRNWWLGLALMHNLFAKEHNAIADMLAEAYPSWTDQQIYDKARMINAAVLAKIHTVDWTPAILPNKTLEVGMNANWQGLNNYFDLGLPTPPAELRVGPAAAVLHGVVGSARDDKGVPYTLTEEFVSVYRMHPLLPDRVDVHDAETGMKLATYKTEMTQKSLARAIEEEYPMSDLLYSFGRAHPGALVLQNYPKFIQELQIPFVGVLDMGTVDILRDRERGIPRYNDFRRQLRLKPLGSLEELTDDPQLLAHLRQLYGDDAGAIERVDALVGTFAEAQRPDCYGFGETLFQVFTLMATRRLQADRFYTNSFNASVYTPEGMAWIEGASMKNVLLRHYPELADTGLADVSNAFQPWE